MFELTGGNFGLAVRFLIQHGHGGSFDALVDETLAAIQSSEPGTFAYVVHRDSTDADVRVFYELYRDRVAFEEHERMPHVQRFVALRGEHLRAEPEVWRITPTVGIVRSEDDPNGT